MLNPTHGLGTNCGTQELGGRRCTSAEVRSLAAESLDAIVKKLLFRHAVALKYAYMSIIVKNILRV